MRTSHHHVALAACRELDPRLLGLTLGCLTEAKLTPRVTIGLPGPSGALALEGTCVEAPCEPGARGPRLGYDLLASEAVRDHYASVLLRSPVCAEVLGDGERRCKHWLAGFALCPLAGAARVLLSLGLYMGGRALVLWGTAGRRA